LKVSQRRGYNQCIHAYLTNRGEKASIDDFNSTVP